MRVLPTFLVLLALVLSACSSDPSQDSHYVTVKIYHTNDVHAHFLPDGQGHGGFAYLASVLKVIRAQEPDALVIDAGDYYKKGSMPAQLSHDQVTADLLHLMPYYDARAVGNNEVKVGISKLEEWAKKTEPAPLLSANFQDKDSNPVFAASLVIKKNGLTFGIIGVTPPGTLDDPDPGVQPDPKVDSRAPYKIADVESAVMPLVKKLKPQVDVLILLAHNPYKDNVKLAAAHPEIDLIVSGHSHVLTPDQKRLGGNMVVEAGEFGHQLGLVTLVYDREAHQVASLDSTFWPIGVDLQMPDVQMTAAIQAAYKKWAPDAFEKLGTVDSDLTLIDAENPYEGSFHDFAADVFCAKTACDLALVNREMFRESVRKGEIKRETIFLAAPYDDKIALVSIARTKILSALDESIKVGFPKAGDMPWGFSKAKTKMTVDEDHGVSALVVDLESKKTSLKVALPLYVVNHCRDFFSGKICPLPKPEIHGDVRRALEDAIISAQHLSAPALDRVQVDSEDDTPEAVNE